MPRQRAALSVAAVLVLGTVACARHSPTVAALACSPADTLAASSIGVDSLPGNYHIVATALSGSRAGASTRGALTLSRFASPGRADAATGTPYATSFPLYGSTTIVPDSVGAAAGGAVTASDPAAPGVLVLDSGSGDARTVTLRLGAEVNRETPTAFDGSHFVLTLRTARAGRLVGTWRSGTSGKAPPMQSSGYFCAERTP